MFPVKTHDDYVCFLIQIAYLENLLKVYNDEIYRLQQAELSLDDMETEDSTYIQEHKLKRKVDDVKQIELHYQNKDKIL